MKARACLKYFVHARSFKLILKKSFSMTLSKFNVHSIQVYLTTTY